MCGFAGFCDTKERFIGNGKEIAGRMADMIRHRGPDSDGCFSDSFLSVGFCRLKIIDYEKGDQPMFSPDGRYLICFNGEIYNYVSLRKQLESDFGVKFRTSSDTEVLLFSCICYGKGVFRFLRGMYSFLFYDRKERRILAARDPFGIKPLYYGMFDGCLLMASEIKAMLMHPLFKKEFNSGILPYYLQFQYVPTEETAFTGVKRLLPGHFLSYDGSELITKRYFRLPKPNGKHYESYAFYDSETEKLPRKYSKKETVDAVSEAVTDSVGIHQNADCEVGVFLSGGVDSGLICALSKPKKAYTAGFSDADFDERDLARRTSDFTGSELITENITPDDFFGAVSEVQYHSDEPYANLSAVPLYLIAKRASSDVKVLLSGEGADEFFGGYEWYLDSGIGKLYRKLPEGIRKLLSSELTGDNKIGRFASRNKTDTEENYIGQARIMTSTEAYSILSERYKSLKRHTDITLPYYKQLKHASALDKKLWLDRHLWLAYDILNKADKMTMASSVELRVPYLDLKVLGAAQGLSERMLVRGKTTKYAFRKAAAKVLPKEIAFAPKRGFPVPFRNWLKTERFRDTVLSTIESSTGKLFFDTEKLKNMLDMHFRGKENNARVLYTVFSFIKWYDVFFSTPFPKNFTMDTENENEKTSITSDNTRL